MHLRLIQTIKIFTYVKHRQPKTINYKSFIITNKNNGTVVTYFITHPFLMLLNKTRINKSLNKVYDRKTFI